MGHARDFVEAQWLMLQQPEPEDVMIATGVQHSVHDFVNAAVAALEIPLQWNGAVRGKRHTTLKVIAL